MSTTLPVKCAIHGVVQQLSEPSEFAQKAPSGGCRRGRADYRRMHTGLVRSKVMPTDNSDEARPCGHVCKKPVSDSEVKLNLVPSRGP